MTRYYSVSADFGRMDISQYANASGLRVFKENLRDPGIMPDPPVTEWTRRAHGPAPDWTPASVPLFSARMKDTVVDHMGDRDAVEWLSAVVISGDGLREEFWIPHFVERPEVLSREASTWGVNGQPILWVLDMSKVAGLHFFPSHAFGRNVIVSSDLRDALQAAELSGLHIERARAVE